MLKIPPLLQLSHHVSCDMFPLSTPEEQCEKSVMDMASSVYYKTLLLLLASTESVLHLRVGVVKAIENAGLSDMQYPASLLLSTGESIQS